MLDAMPEESSKVIPVPEIKKEPVNLDPDTAKRMEELFGILKNGQPYMAAFTTSINGKLDHHLITNMFPDVLLLKSWKAIEGLVVERLESL